MHHCLTVQLFTWIELKCIIVLNSSIRAAANHSLVPWQSLSLQSIRAVTIVAKQLECHTCSNDEDDRLDYNVLIIVYWQWYIYQRALSSDFCPLALPLHHNWLQWRKEISQLLITIPASSLETYPPTVVGTYSVIWLSVIRVNCWLCTVHALVLLLANAPRNYIDPQRSSIWEQDSLKCGKYCQTGGRGFSFVSVILKRALEENLNRQTSRGKGRHEKYEAYRFKHCQQIPRTGDWYHFGNDMEL